MALVTTILTVVAMLGGISLLLWFSTFVENRHLGPAGVDLTDSVPEQPAAAPAPALSIMDAVQPAA